MTSMKNVQFLHPFPAPIFSLSQCVRIGKDTLAPERQNLGYQQPSRPRSTPIRFGIFAAYRLYLVDVSITYHARATHNSLQLKINLN